MNSGGSVLFGRGRWIFVFSGVVLAAIFFCSHWRESIASAQGRPVPVEKQRVKSRPSADGNRAQAAQPGAAPAAVPGKQFTRAEKYETKFRELIDRIEGSGAVPVIVGLRVGFQLEGEFSASREVGEQRGRIAQMQSRLLRAVSGYRPESVKRFESIPFLAMEIDAEGLKALRASQDVISIEEDRSLPPDLIESTQIVGAQAAWASGFSGAGQAIAILDTGVDKAHSFLSGKVVSEACYSTTSGVATSVCPGGATTSTAAGSGVNCAPGVTGCDHGTHVAGIAAGKGSTFSGVARDANLIAVQVFSRIDSATQCQPSASPCARTYYSDLIRGLERVGSLQGTYKIAAVNMSLGGGQFFSSCDTDNPSVTTAISNLRSIGIASVLSAGNSGYTNSIGFPACISSAISVGSTDDGSLGTTLDQVSQFSNSANILTLLAPGNVITSSIPDNKFGPKAGTSMAAPHVAGALAVLKAAAPSASIADMLSALSMTGKPITDSRNGIVKPRIRVDAAVNALTGGNCTYSISPTTQSIAAAGGTGTATVGAGTGCSWQAASNVPWISILTGASGSGNGTVTYSVQANSSGTARNGSITIAGQTLNIAQAGTGLDPCSTATPIIFGQQLNGRLAAGDCRFTDGSYVDFYGFNATGGQQIAIEMSSAAFDTYLLLIDPNGNVIAQDDDGGGGTNSRIPTGAGFFTIPSTGRYLIAANSFNGGDVGDYSINLTQQSGSGGNTIQLVDGVSQQGTLPATFGALASTQYSILVPPGTGQLVIKIDSGQDVDLFVRFGSRVGQAANGAFIADYAAQSFGGTETIVINQFSTPPLQSGIYYIGAANYGSITATIYVSATTGPPLTGNPVELKVDDGSFETQLTPSAGGTSWIANRLTPPNYPATLSAVKISFPSASGISLNKTFYIVVGTNTDGNGDINGTSYTTVTGTVTAYDQFLTFAVPQITIGTGDFVVGFWITVENGAFPFALDRSSPSQRRSYFSTNGFTFTLLDDFSNNVGGNLGLRAIANVPQQCTYALSQSSFAAPAAGGNGSVNVSSPDGCSWTAASASNFITITSPAGAVSGNGQVAFSVAPNTSTASRSGAITIAGQSFTVTQEGLSCSYTLSQTTLAVQAAGGNGSVTIGTTAGCSWTAASETNWIKVQNGESGSGSGTVSFSVESNASPNSRQGTLKIAGQTVTVNQTGAVTSARVVRVAPVNGAAGSRVAVPIELISQGDENALSFSLNFDPAILSGPQASLGTDAANGTLNANTNQAGQGRVGIVLSLPSGQRFAAGTRHIVTVSFAIAAGATVASTPIGFSDQPVPREISDPNANALNATYTGGAVTLANPRVVRVLSANGAPGAQVNVPIELISQGDESALSFSLSFDPAVLSSPRVTAGTDAAAATINTNTNQAAQGKLGVVLGLPSGQRFAAGNRQILLVGFTVAGSTTVTTTQIEFADAPVPREISDPEANALTATYTGGVVSFASPGLEADVAPRPNGNNAVTVTDWVQLGRYIAGTETVPPGSEFQRADCAPRDTLGNGVLTATDWVQAGRYVAGIDPTVSAGGPTGPNAFGQSLALFSSFEGGSLWRRIGFSPQRYRAGRNRSLIIEMDSQGDENALGLSFEFDVSRFRFISVEAGPDALQAVVNVNAAYAKEGRIGILLGLPPGQSFAAGLRRAVVVNLLQLDEATVTSPTITFSDFPIPREIADREARALLAWFETDEAVRIERLYHVSAAGRGTDELLQDAVITGFGRHLATASFTAGDAPAYELGGTFVLVEDSLGIERRAELLYVSPTRLQYRMPRYTAPGPVWIRVFSHDRVVSVGVAIVAPPLPVFRSQ